MRILAWIIGAIGVTLTAFMLLTAGWERPPIDAVQTGFRGTGMADISNPRVDPATLQAQLAAMPESVPLPADAGGGPTAGQIYQNVPLLGHLSIVEFNHLMQAITDWVSPEQGCAYCHQLDNLAADTVYTKLVSRRMLEMTQTINIDWGSHVGETGVTCYTCHRGENVPQYSWFNADPDIYGASGMVGWRNGQNRASPQVGLTSLPEDPFSALIEGNEDIRVTGRTALPVRGANGSSIQDTERTFALMVHMSSALNVNCTHCHNSRDFGSWAHSPVQRVTAWHGLEMTQTMNVDYVIPVSADLPPHRLGPTGQGQKVNCETCHQGVNKPLGGLAMAQNYPSLLSRAPVGSPAPAPVMDAEAMPDPDADDEVEADEEEDDIEDAELVDI